MILGDHFSMLEFPEAVFPPLVEDFVPLLEGLPFETGFGFLLGLDEPLELDFDFFGFLGVAEELLGGKTQSKGTVCSMPSTNRTL